MGFCQLGDVRIGIGTRIHETAIVGLSEDGDNFAPTVVGDGAVIGPFAVVRAGCRLGRNFRCGIGAMIGPEVSMGGDCSVGVHSIVRNAVFGDRVTIQDLVLIGVMPQSKYDYKGVAGEWQAIVRIGEDSTIRSHTVIYAKTVFGEHFDCGHGVMIRECQAVGHHTVVGSNSQLDGFGSIGNNVLIHSNATVSQFCTLEDDSYVTLGAVLTNTLHPRCSDAKQCMKGATLKRGAKVCANATLMPDIVVGENAVVGAGAVVIGDVPPGSVVVGIPAKPVRDAHQLTCPYDICEGPYVDCGRAGTLAI